MKHALEFAVEFAVAHLVAFTPKGGCPLKRDFSRDFARGIYL